MRRLNLFDVKYISTRGHITPIGFRDSVMMGLADDGGLLLPERIPDVTSRLDAWRGLSYEDLAFEIMQLYADDIPPTDLRDLIRRSYAVFRDRRITPTVPLKDLFVLELFHGPTLAFKDVALQFLGNMFEYILRQSGRRLNILAATSGDTGSAAIHGIRGRAGMTIFVMHPHGRISRTQEIQMTSVLDANVFNMAIEGTFDDCQQIMKSIFTDVAFKETYSLGSVNSINWARVLAQVVYYFYSGLEVMRTAGSRQVMFCVPTGNFGDIFAGYVAVRMGLPVRHLVLATNENDILCRFFRTGEYKTGTVRATLSPSMDIQVASNFERYLYYRMNEDADCTSRMLRSFGTGEGLSVQPGPDGRIDPLFIAGTADDAQTLHAIRTTYADSGYLLDPHSAVAVHVARTLRESSSTSVPRDVPLICLATAHPAKFSRAILNATGQDLARHPVIDALSGASTRCEVFPNSVDVVRHYMETNLGPMRRGGKN